ncbi:MAG: hypothetical protein U9O94_00105, partial [Nanoarchaeota archaeon]|nr:hypothetical protein [Nanoarchaeota archaeon]
HNSTFESGASFLSDRDIGPDIANGYTIRRISQENGSSHQTFFVDHYVRMGIPPAVENEYHGNLDENDIQEFFKEGWMPKDVNPLIEIFNLLLDDSSSEERGFRTAFKGFIKDKTTIDEIKEFFEVDIVSCNEIHKYTHNKITPAVAKSYNYGADSTVKFVKHGVDNKYANLFKEIRSDDWKIVSRAFRGYIGHIDWTSDIIELHERKVSKDKIKAYAKLNSDYGVNINPEDMLNYERRGIKFSTIRAEAEKRYAAKLLE